MPISVVMPALELAQDTGKLVCWRKQEGETVRKGEVLLEVETDKAVVEVEALADGVLSSIQAQPGETVPVGRTIAWIIGMGETVPPDPVTDPAPVGNARPWSFEARQAPASIPEAKRIRISPKARRIARERGVEIEGVHGSGSDGEILVADILAAAELHRGEAATPGSTAEAVLRASGVASLARAPSSIGRLMAERTTEGWTCAPHFFLTREVEASGLKKTKQRLSGRTGPAGASLTHTDLLILMVAHSLERHPLLNASWREQSIRLNEEINIGLAMAVPEGVVTGVIHGANRIDLNEIHDRRRELAERARTGRLRPNDISGATFTISNLGMYHVNAFTAIIVRPQAAILAVGEITDRVIALSGKPAVRPMITLTLSCDHRVVDGARAAEFMHTLALTFETQLH